MNDLDLDNEDEVDKIAQGRLSRRDRHLTRAGYTLLILLSLECCLHWIFGGYETLIATTIGLWFAVVLAGVLNGFGVFDHHAEMRHRIKLLDERVAGIEKILSNRRRT